MKILIGVDPSDYARAAVDFVAGLSWPPGASVVAVSVLRPLALYAELYSRATHGLEPGMDDLLEEQAKECRDLLARFEKRLRDAGLAVETRILRGDPREALVDAAKTERADLVVVGSHGRSGLARVLMGSVASHVVTHAPCSVLVVKQPSS